MDVPTPIRAEAIFRAAQDRIKGYIVEHSLVPGDPLPTELEFTRQLGIGRNSLREALKALETVGIVETRHGLGSYVGRASLAPLIAGMAFNLVQGINEDTRTLRELLELREILEVELVRRVTGQHTPEQLAELEEIVAAMEVQAAQGHADADGDRAFHHALYEPLENAVVTLLLRAFFDILTMVESQLPAATHSPLANAAWHRAIVEATRRGDAVAAVAAMREQFTGANGRLTANLAHCNAKEAAMRALRLTAPLMAEVVELPPPGLPPGGVIVRALRTAISTGTEIRQYRDERVEQNPAGFPRANGYSMVGEIVALDDTVRGLTIGQRVFVTAPHDEFVAVSPEQVYLMPPGAPDDGAVFAVICEIGLHALRRGEPSLGENVAVIGQGIVGLATLAVARAWGLRTIALDLDERRLTFARAVGADLVLNPQADDFAARLADFCGEVGVDFVVEAASSWRAIGLAYRIVRRRGTIAVVARHTDIPDFNPIQDGLMTKEVRFTTSYAHPVTDAPPDLLRWTRPRDIRLILEMLGKGRLDLSGVISHRITPDDLPAIYQRLHEGDGAVAGVVIDWSD